MVFKQAVFPSSSDASEYLAEHIIRRINEFGPTAQKPFVLGLPTGSSPIQVYSKLIEAYKQGRVSFKNVVTFNMDEYLGLKPTDPQSYHYFMFNKFFNHVDVPRENINILNGLAEDVELECLRYEAKIRSHGRINFFMGGLGPEGHLAFNEAGSARNSITRKVSLVQSTIDANSRFFDNDLSKVPKYALSVGISTVLDNSDEVAIIVSGKNKQFALEKTVHGKKNDPSYPSSYLQDHPNVLIVCDKEAAGLKSKL
ncbi:Piso0_000566 [Millerozyma farinosa CBS 7064]|uniref:Glucosamine-6-phosphate isomerase n=1 Tax=Pichia sorbitophila (strain ATCC MYA-4447 / BCRC 22081 / CBS 7064 / NBRC 10061 / NRRL Y-12695) TaxID=559304 RepID=G8YVS6_PICSO|nr:Piso0_000566 [Millerozyma farinosa CBS 7064]CCE73520.1 Piso0_000566 [Millerozyma farinosa CBS 7064]